jgi:hypothetical protein
MSSGLSATVPTLRFISKRVTSASSHLRNRRGRRYVLRSSRPISCIVRRQSEGACWLLRLCIAAPNAWPLTLPMTEPNALLPDN